ncbi:MAG: ferrous iron transport protein B [Candidatus Zixiibacteriota bacterium]
MKSKPQIKIALAGNPNAGKTSIFNNLTGARQRVANFPGVTVEKRVGFRSYRDYDITFVDLPGTYSLTAYTIDEKVAREFIINEQPDLIINVIDSCALERSLYLTLQLIEMSVDIVIDLNMWDEAKESGVEIDANKLSELLGAPVVKTIGSRSQGIENLLDTAIDLFEVGRHSEKNGNGGHHQRQYRKQHGHVHRHPPISYGSQLDDVVVDLSHEIKQCKGCTGCGNPRWLAIKLLEGDQEIRTRCIPDETQSPGLTEKLNQSISHLKSTAADEPEIAITEGRYGYAAGIVREVLKAPKTDRMQFSTHLDYFLTHKYFGYPVFLVIMWLIFQATFVIGQYPMGWIESGIENLQMLLASAIPAGVISDMIINGIIGGVGSVIVFLPNIIIMFLGISILEDSGYMSRAAFLMDRLMHFLGLHGKSFIPLLMGFGCSVPAIMSTRTLESQRDRILTVLLIPFMSCSAKLPVYVLFAGAFFGVAAGNVIFVLYTLGIVIAIVAARIFLATILKGESLPFVMELPPYRMPGWKSVAIHMWERTKIYLKKMGGVILIASIVLWGLGFFPVKTEFSTDYEAQIEELSSVESQPALEEIARLRAQKSAESLEYTFIGRLGDFVEPVVAPLGFNWQMGVALLTGVVAKEVVVSTLGVLYQLGDDANEQSESLIKTLQNPKNGVSPLAAFAFMAFVLFYTPCIVAVLAVKREVGAKWMFFTANFQLALAWLAAFIIYQGGKLLGLG